MANFFQQKTNPAPLGFVRPTAGTPKALSSNFTDLTGVAFMSVMIQSNPGGGNVYILSNSTAADKTNGTNVIAIIAGGQSLPIQGLALGGVTPSQIYVDVDTTGDYAIPSVQSA